MKKYIKYFSVSVFIAAAILFTFSMVGCSMLDDIKENIAGMINKSDVEEEAVNTVEEFFNCIIEKDFVGAYSYVYIQENGQDLQDSTNEIQNADTDQQASKENKIEAEIADFIDEFKDVTTIIKIETKWIEVKNNIAIVGIDLIDTYDGEEKIYKDIEVSLVKDSQDNWKINFWN